MRPSADHRFQIVSPATGILVGLIAGLATGAAVHQLGGAEWLLAGADVIGGLWLDGLRMTIVPLVFLLIVTGIVGSAKNGDRAIARRTLPLFAALLFASALVGLAIGSMLLSLWSLPDDVGSLTGAGFAEVPKIPSPVEWLRSLVPSNPIAAAASGAIVPLTTFALLFGLAASRLATHQAEPFVAVFRSMLDALLVIVRWLLLLAPFGVFALALSASSRVGLGIGAALIGYLGTQIVATLALGACMYLLVKVARVGLVDFAKAAAPAQAIAFSTQSSLASLPAMISGCERLRLNQAAAAAVLPLAVAIFRIAAPASIVIVTLTLAKLNQAELGGAQISIIIILATLNTLVIAGLPNQITFFAAYAPPAIAAGVPIEMLPLMLAIDVIPDMFYTVSNVTADIAVAAITAKRGTGDGSVD